MMWCTAGVALQYVLLPFGVLIQPESNWEDCMSMTADSGSMQLFNRLVVIYAAKKT
jgi:hypothetical protein